MIHATESLKELHEQRFAAMDKATVLAAEKTARRLENLNHFHELGLSCPPVQFWQVEENAANASRIEKVHSFSRVTA